MIAVLAIQLVCTYFSVFGRALSNESSDKNTTTKSLAISGIFRDMITQGVRLNLGAKLYEQYKETINIIVINLRNLSSQS